MDLTEKACENNEFRENTVTSITQLIEDEEYHCRPNNGFPGAFTRNRKLNFNNLVVFISRGVKSSYNENLIHFTRRPGEANLMFG